MGLPHLGLGAMVSLTELWVTELKELFLSTGEIAGLMPHVERVHAGVSKATKALKSVDQNLIRQQTELDGRHDRLVRGIDSLVEGHAQILLAQNPPKQKEADQLLAIRDKLFPDGLKTVNESYLEEAGLAERAKQTSTREIQTELKKYGAGLQNDTLADAFRDYLKVAGELGQLERKKLGLVTGTSEEPNLAKARSEWLKVVSTVLDGLALVSPEVADKLAGPFRAAADKATPSATNTEETPEPVKPT